MPTLSKQAVIDTNVSVALVDGQDTWHTTALALREALKVEHIHILYCDAVLNETISVLARWAQEQRRSQQFLSLLATLTQQVPTEVIMWLSTGTQRLYDRVLDLIRSTAGHLNFHDRNGL